jgi:hypothetical protein
MIMDDKSRFINFSISFAIFYILSAVLFLLVVPFFIDLNDYQCISGGTVKCIEMLLSAPALIFLLLMPLLFGLSYYKIRENPSILELSACGGLQILIFFVLGALMIELIRILLSILLV